MDVVHYKKELHEKSFREICVKRGLSFPENLPPRGLVVLDIAFEFYYLSDCGQLMVPHFFITNPDREKIDRDSAIKKIIEALPIVGLALKAKVIWSATATEKSSFNEAWKNAGMRTWKCEAGEWIL